MAITGRYAAAIAALLTPVAAFGQPAPVGIEPVELSSEPYVFDTAEQHKIKVTVLAKDFRQPFALEFLPGGDLLVMERGWDLRIIRDATTPGARLDPEAVPGMPRMDPGRPNMGPHDIALHPDFAANGLIYWTYNAPVFDPDKPDAPPEVAELQLMRGRLENGGIGQAEVLLANLPSYPGGSRIHFAPDGLLYMSTGAPFGDLAQDRSSLYGKVLRLKDDGSIPDDNPHVGEEGVHPAVYSLGHRDQHGLTVHTGTGDIFTVEHGPNGGDEANLIRPGANYGWPLYSYGRNYDGSELTELPTAPGFEKPLLVWSPSIAPSGLMFYQGDAFPAWTGNLFIGSARRGEINSTGGLERVVLNESFGELRRETLLTQLHQRVRDMAEGPDGLIYVLTDGPENAVLRIEPHTP